MEIVSIGDKTANAASVKSQDKNISDGFQELLLILAGMTGIVQAPKGSINPLESIKQSDSALNTDLVKNSGSIHLNSKLPSDETSSIEASIISLFNDIKLKQGNPNSLQDIIGLLDKNPGLYKQEDPNITAVLDGILKNAANSSSLTDLLNKITPANITRIEKDIKALLFKGDENPNQKDSAINTRIPLLSQLKSTSVNDAAVSNTSSNAINSTNTGITDNSAKTDASIVTILPETSDKAHASLQNSGTINLNNVSKEVGTHDSKPNAPVELKPYDPVELKPYDPVDLKLNDHINLKINKDDGNQDVSQVLGPNTEKLSGSNIYNDIKPEFNGVKPISNPQDLVDVVVEKFQALRLPESTELRVKLKPEDLGDITVKVILEKGQISGSISTEKRDVANMLQGQMDALRQDLKNNNINLNHISVNVSTDQDLSKFNQRQHNNGSRKSPKRFAADVEESFNTNTNVEGFNIIA